MILSAELPSDTEPIRNSGSRRSNVQLRCACGTAILGPYRTKVFPQLNRDSQVRNDSNHTHKLSIPNTQPQIPRHHDNAHQRQIIPAPPPSPAPANPLIICIHGTLRATYRMEHKKSPTRRFPACIIIITRPRTGHLPRWGTGPRRMRSLRRKPLGGGGWCLCEGVASGRCGMTSRNGRVQEWREVVVKCIWWLCC